MQIIKGNKSRFVISVRDQDDNVITDLATATAVKYQIKASKISTPLISKTDVDGIEVDTPNVGDLRITILPADAIDAGEYFQACQVEYSATDIQEIYIYENNKKIDTIEVLQDIIQ